MSDVASYNRQAWDHQVEHGNRWTCPVTTEAIARARTGDLKVVLTPQKPVPSLWFPSPFRIDLLGLACGGGQQAPLFAAAGARVTVLDNSPKQLEQDQVVARREGLSIQSELGDMRDLGRFDDESFDLIFNPCSVSFIPNLQPVFDEAFRVLRPGGSLMCGFTNPARFIFDDEQLEQGKVRVRHELPYADETHLNSKELLELRRQGEPMMFSHSLEELIAGQARAGFLLVDLFEDHCDRDTISKFCPMYLATKARKPATRS